MGVIRRSQIAVKVEATEGTAETLANADANIEAESPSVSLRISGELLDRRVVSSTLDNFSTVPGQRSFELEFEQHLKGSGAAGTAPAWGKLMKALGWTETVNAGVSVVYTLANTAPSSYTVGLYEDGVRWLGVGCRGSGSLEFRPGRPIILRARLMGAFSSYSTTALLSPTYDTTVPPALLSASLSLDSYAARATELDIDFGTVLEMVESFSTASGFVSAVITDGSITGRMLTEAVPTATKDWYSLASAATEGALSIAAGATAGNIITTTAPKVQWAIPTRAPIGGRSGVELSLRMNRNSGGDGLVITLT